MSFDKILIDKTVIDNISQICHRICPKFSRPIKILEFARRNSRDFESKLGGDKILRGEKNTIFQSHEIYYIWSINASFI